MLDYNISELSNSSSNQSLDGPGYLPGQDDRQEQLLMRILQMVVSGIGFVLCSLVLALLAVRFRSKWTKQMILLANILLCDVVASSAGFVTYFTDYINMVPGQLGLAAEGFGPLRNNFCATYIAQQIFSSANTANLFGLLLLTIDHLIAVHWSLKHATVRKLYITISCLISWLVAIVLGCLPGMLLASQYVPAMTKWREKGTTYFCFQANLNSLRLPSGAYLHDLNQSFHYTLSFWLAVSIIFLVFAVMLAVYTYIAVIVVSLNKRKKQQNRQYSLTKRNLKGVGTTVLILTTFLLLYLPITIAYILWEFKIYISVRWLNIVTLLLSTTGIADVIIYISRNKQIRTLFTSSEQSSRYGVQKPTPTAFVASAAARGPAESNRTSSTRLSSSSSNQSAIRIES